MKLAAPYPLKEERKDKIDEYNITFDKKKHKLDHLRTWLLKQKNDSKRINIELLNNDNWTEEEIKAILLTRDNLYFKITPAQDFSIFVKNSYPFFLSDQYQINSFWRLADVLRLGVSDVYIAEDLCYKLKQVKSLCDDYNVRLRIVLNHIPAYSYTKQWDPTSPWFTPENFDELSKHFDIAEFDLYNSWNRFDTLYKIWFEDKVWREDIKFLNFDLGINIPGETFVSDVCEYKMNCGHRCIERNDTCNKCEQYVEFAKTMKEKGYELDFNKEWVKINDDEVVKDIF